jgi:hypothetical protein
MRYVNLWTIGGAVAAAAAAITAAITTAAVPARALQTGGGPASQQAVFQPASQQAVLQPVPGSHPDLAKVRPGTFQVVGPVTAIPGGTTTTAPRASVAAVSPSQ